MFAIARIARQGRKARCVAGWTAALLLLLAVSSADAQSYTFTTFAGTAPGSADGTGAAARFYNPYGVATDSAGNVYVADYNNNPIRKITPEGVVSTLAGTARASGSADGTGPAARFSYPFGVATGSAGNVYVGDSNNHTIRLGGPFKKRHRSVRPPL